MGHVQRRQIHQLEGAELEADLVFQDAVDGGEVGHTFAHDTQGFGAVGPAGMVDDEARRVLGLHRGVPHLVRVGAEACAHGGVSLEARDDLDHFHQRHRVEEVVTRQPLRALEAGADSRDGQRGGVGGQHRVRPHDVFQVGKQLALDVDAFDGGFDHQVAWGQVGQRGGGLQAGLVGLVLGSVDPALFQQLVPLRQHGGMGLLHGRCVDVEKMHLAAGLGRDLGDAATHGTRSHDAHMLVVDFHVS